jgi:peptidoglycan hydrolase-like protein with peptidoglycan-binding domain
MRNPSASIVLSSGASTRPERSIDKEGAMPSVAVSKETVRAAQILLVGFGFPLDMDGVVGPDTRKAIKEFQRRRKLPRTGELDAATLKALGLPPPESIEFGVDDTDVPAHVRRRIEEYAEALGRKHRMLLEKSKLALDNFQTTLATASIREANPDLVGVLASAAYQAGGSLLQSYIKSNALGAGVGFVIDLVSRTRAELERAAAAATERDVATFVKHAVRTIDNQSGQFHQARLEEEVSLAFLESSDRQRFLDVLSAASGKLEAETLAPLPFFELKYYEAWINAHFNGFREDGRGVIAYRFAFDGEIEVLGCLVDAPQGERIEDELNGFLARRDIAGLVRPIDLRVRKRACFRVENLVGGTSTSCGWLGATNEVAHEPSLPNARKAFAEPVWRVAVSRFMR